MYYWSLMDSHFHTLELYLSSGHLWVVQVLMDASFETREILLLT